MPVKPIVLPEDPAQRLELLLSFTVENADTGCREWTRGCDEKGYGRLWIGPERRYRKAHRLAAECVYGPTELHVCHHCDNPPCIWPEHLFLGTQADNLADAARKGRMTRGEQATRGKLTEEEVVEIRQQHAAGVGREELARRFGVHVSSLHGILHGLAWRHAGGPILPRARWGVLTADEVREIRRLHAGGLSQTEIARRFAVTAGNVHLIVRGRTWRNVEEEAS